MKIPIVIERDGETVTLRINGKALAVLTHGESWSGSIELSAKPLPGALLSVVAQVEETDLT
jgi:hypothetical protein